MIDVLIIGGGIAGIETACSLQDLGYETIIVEKEKTIGGHLNDWDTLFPTHRSASEVLAHYIDETRKRALTIYLNTYVISVKKQDDGTFEVHTSRDVVFRSKAVVVASGYKLFNAERKEEYGYKIYDNVLTSADLEVKLKDLKGEFKTPTDKVPERIAFIHCVGSRDEKSGNHYCSKLCCVTAVKQAIHLKQLCPKAEIFCCYMDLRMYGPGFEEMYREAQEKYHIQFIRGRLSEVGENSNGTLQLKVEDTLAARPCKIQVDMLVLMVGMESAKSTELFAQSCGLKCAPNRFIQPLDHHIGSNLTNVEGLFTAGTSIGPMSVFDTVNHAKATAFAIRDYFINTAR
ncbi:MAG: CoB--CoM heterodisulfide reductase iron-sulfur subunit A family protein [Bacteroidales bacterium]|nr:CoB--CoM heterodisulfide reductase iron-sulfur subunit A family protein [Bacteroidales bacterium]